MNVIKTNNHVSSQNRTTTLYRCGSNRSYFIRQYVLQVEECILESHAWKQDSPLWDAIRENNGVPVCEEVWFPVLICNEIIIIEKV